MKIIQYLYNTNISKKKTFNSNPGDMQKDKYKLQNDDS